jgi:hypothetical protein
MPKANPMYKKQVALYLAPDKIAALKLLHARTRIPQQTFLREAVDAMLAKYKREWSK